MWSIAALGGSQGSQIYPSLVLWTLTVVLVAERTKLCGGQWIMDGNCIISYQSGRENPSSVRARGGQS